MSDKKSVRLNKLAKEFNVGMDRILAFLDEKGVEGIKPSSKISHDLYMDLLGKFQPDLKAKLAADLASKEREYKREQQRIEEEQALVLEQEKKKASNIAKEKRKEEEKNINVSEKIDIEPKKKPSNKEVEVSQKESEADISLIKAKAKTLSGPKITGEKIDLNKLSPTPKKKKPVETSSNEVLQKKKRKRITNKVNPKKFVKNRGKAAKAPIEIDPEEAQKKIRETLFEGKQLYSLEKKLGIKHGSIKLSEKDIFVIKDKDGKLIEDIRNNDEIESDMDSIITGNVEGLVGSWTFNMGEGEILGDHNPPNEWNSPEPNTLRHLSYSEVCD